MENNNQNKPYYKGVTYNKTNNAKPNQNALASVNKSFTSQSNKPVKLEQAPANAQNGRKYSDNIPNINNLNKRVSQPRNEYGTFDYNVLHQPEVKKEEIDDDKKFLNNFKSNNNIDDELYFDDEDDVEFPPAFSPLFEDDDEEWNRAKSLFDGKAPKSLDFKDLIYEGNARNIDEINEDKEALRKHRESVNKTTGFKVGELETVNKISPELNRYMRDFGKSFKYHSKPKSAEKLYGLLSHTVEKLDSDLIVPDQAKQILDIVLRYSDGINDTAYDESIKNYINKINKKYETSLQFKKEFGKDWRKALNLWERL